MNEAFGALQELARSLECPLSLCTTLNAYGDLRMQQANWLAAEQA